MAMLTPDERARFNDLRDRNDSGETLSPSEPAEIAHFARRLEAAEAAYLAPATERLQQENIASAGRIEAAERLAVLEERFATRLEQTVSELRREREFLRGERQRIWAGVGA